MSGSVGLIKKRVWSHPALLKPMCPGCRQTVDLERWEVIGASTCGSQECVTFFTEEILGEGFDWDGTRIIALTEDVDMGDKPDITREEKPDGTIVLSKKSDEGASKWSPSPRSGGSCQTAPSPSTPSMPSKVVSPVTQATPPQVYRPIVDLSKRQVFIHPQAFWDLQYLVRSCPMEISGLGIVDTLPEGLMIKSVHLLKQEGGASHTEMDPEAIAELMMEIDAAGEDTGKLRFWWHSHPGSSGNPGPSGTDINTFASFGRGAPGIAPDWYINAIFNSGGGQYWRLDIYRPIRTAIEISPTMWHPLFGSRDWEAEMKEKITRGGGVRGPVNNQAWHGYWHGLGMD